MSGINPKNVLCRKRRTTPLTNKPRNETKQTQKVQIFPGNRIREKIGQNTDTTTTASHQYLCFAFMCMSMPNRPACNKSVVQPGSRFGLYSRLSGLSIAIRFNIRPHPGPNLCWLLHSSSEEGRCERVMSISPLPMTIFSMRASTIFRLSSDGKDGQRS